MFELGHRPPFASAHAHRICDSTIKNGSTLMQLLRSLADDLPNNKSILLTDYGARDLRTILFGNWLDATRLTKCNTSDVHSRLLRLRVEWLTECNCHAARVWMTAHVRMHLWVMSSNATSEPPSVLHPRPALCTATNLLPDPRRYLLGIPLFQVTALKSVGSGKCKLTHLLNKCLPKRCQIRELTRFLSDYCRNDEIVRCCFERMLFCSLGGLYAHCSVSVPFGILTSLCVTLLYRPKDTNCIISWMQTADKPHMSRIQYICLHVVREYLCTCVCTQPTLRYQLCRYFDWHKFEKQSFDAMHHLRKLLYAQCPADRFDLSGVHILSMFSQTIQKQIQKESTPVAKPRCTLTIDTVLRLFCKGRTKQLNMIDSHNILTLESVCADIVARSCRCTAIGVIDRMTEMCNDEEILAVIRSIVRCIHCNTADHVIGTLLGDLLDRDMLQYILLEYELRQVSEQLTTRVYRLHTHTHDMQRDAVARQMGSACESPFHSNLFYCRSCDTVANSCARRNTCARNRVQSHIMSVKAVVDDDNGMLLCAQSNKQSHIYTTNTRTITFENCLSNTRCRQQELLVLPICGKLIQVRHGIYCVCVMCGRVTKLDTDLQLKCHACRTEKSDDCEICFMCKKTTTQTQHILCFSIHTYGMFEATELCQACIGHVCKTIRRKRKANNSHNTLVTRKELTHMQRDLVRRRQLAIPGERYAYFQSESRRK
jgi:hypothetical protein